MNALTHRLQEFVRIPSVNPAHSSNPEITGERAYAKRVAASLELRGFELEWIPILGEDRPALIGRVGDPKAPSLLFELHTDTVGVDHMTRDPFDGAVEEGRLYGRGSCDMKGSAAAMFEALSPERVRSFCERGYQLIVVAAPDEECGCRGAMDLAERGIGADAAIILEPTQNIPVVAHKGAKWLEIELKGRSGHGSEPDRGVSTNRALCRLLPFLHETHAALQEEFSHPLLGQSTLNYGRIEGGATFNIIPDHSLLQLDRRVIPNEDPLLFEQQVKAEVEALQEEGLILEGSVTRCHQTDAFATEEDSPLVQCLLAAIEAETGERPPCMGTSWVSDASPLSQTCEQILVFGPGDIAQAHTEDEYIELASLEQGAAILGRFLDRFSL